MPVIVPISSDKNQVQCEVEFINRSLNDSRTMDASVQCSKIDEQHKESAQGKGKWFHQMQAGFLEAGDASSPARSCLDASSTKSLGLLTSKSHEDGDSSRVIPLNIVEERDECIGTADATEKWNFKDEFKATCNGMTMNQLFDYGILLAFAYVFYLAFW